MKRLSSGVSLALAFAAGVTKDVGVVTVALAYVGTNAGKSAYASPANGKFTGRDALLLTVSKEFRGRTLPLPWLHGRAPEPPGLETPRTGQLFSRSEAGAPVPAAA